MSVRFVPAIAASQDPAVEAYLFLADYHALIKNQNPDEVAQSSREIAATWLALGLDPQQAHFYRQSDIPEITELSWVLTCSAAKVDESRTRLQGGGASQRVGGR